MEGYIAFKLSTVMGWVSGQYETLASLKAAIMEDTDTARVVELAAPLGSQDVERRGRPKKSLPDGFSQERWQAMLAAMKEDQQINPEGWTSPRGGKAVRPETDQDRLDEGIVVWNNGVEALFELADDGWPHPLKFMAATKPWEG